MFKTIPLFSFDMSKAPKDSTLLLLLVANDEQRAYPLEDNDKATITLGHNTFEITDEDVWQFSGWCWEHDHYVEGKGTVIGWSRLGNFPRESNGRHGAGDASKS